MRKLNQKGFSAVESLLILVIVVIIVGVGYFVYHTQQKSSDTLNTASTTANQTVSGHSMAKMTGSEAVAFVQNTYNNYLSAETKAAANSAKNPKNAQPVETYGVAAVRQDLSTDFYKLLSPVKPGVDLFGCSPQAKVDSYKAKLGSTSGDTATVNVDINQSGSVSGTINALVNLNDRKITGVTCPA